MPSNHRKIILQKTTAQVYTSPDGRKFRAFTQAQEYWTAAAAEAKKKRKPPATAERRAGKKPGGRPSAAAATARTPGEIPKGWTTETVARPNGQKDKYFIGPGGVRLRSLKKVWEYLGRNSDEDSEVEPDEQVSENHIEGQVWTV